MVSEIKNLLPVLALVVTVYLPAEAIDYEITSLVELQGSHDTSSVSYCKWAREDLRILAVEDRKRVNIYDSVGIIIKTITPELDVQYADWVTKDLICVRSIEHMENPRRSKYRLSIIDLETDVEEVVNEFEMGVNQKIEPNGTSATGILKSIEGNLYYFLTDHDAKGWKSGKIAMPFIKEDSNNIKDDHFLEWAGNSLYRINLDLTDSVRIVTHIFPEIIKQPDISSDGTFATDFGIVFNLLDSTIVVLDTMTGPPPESTYACSIYKSVFNPTANELAFTTSCEGQISHVEIFKSRIGTYDCITGEMKILDSTLELTNCYTPEFSHDGRWISFISGHKSYILTRKFH